jgi:hypothetical protein
LTVETHEVHVEQLLGRKVVDADGRVVGRIEEMRSEMVDGERVVTEFHVGPVALLERIGTVVGELPFFRLLGSRRSGRSIAWKLLDLSDPRHPLLRGRLEDSTTVISRSDRPSHPS